MDKGGKKQDFSAARRAMVDCQLRPQGVTGSALLAAIASIPRERFVPPQAVALAYADCSVLLANGLAMSAPAVTARLIDALAPERGERVLVIGAGAGYDSALFAAMGLEVTALEVAGLAGPVGSAAKPDTGVNMVTGPLAEGWAKGAPYDLILLDGAVEEIPQALVDQLREGGRIGAALVDRGPARLVVGRRSGARLGLRSIGDAEVPRLPGFGKRLSFVF